jgi:murein DD-endopeptidase MepM/ murein hydrolase activator NlpD
MVSAQQFGRSVIQPALQQVGLDSEAAEQLLLGTAIQESQLTYRRQIGGGPARGLFQMEKATHDDIWATSLAYRPDLAGKVRALLSGPHADRDRELETNDRYAAAMARLRYLRAPEALPRAGDIPAMAKYWKKYYNTAHGKGTPEEYLRNWARYTGGQDNSGAQEAVAWPLAVNVIRGHSESNTFGMVRKYADGRPKPHQGWDFQAAVGTPAYAVGDGQVQFVTDHGDYGRQVCISFHFKDKVMYAFYAHMDSISVQPHAAVHRNQCIGKTGKTGNASNLPAAEDHLHFEIRTQANCGLGLPGRVSPLTAFGRCPLHAPIVSKKT